MCRIAYLCMCFLLRFPQYFLTVPVICLFILCISYFVELFFLALLCFFSLLQLQCIFFLGEITHPVLCLFLYLMVQ